MFQLILHMFDYVCIMLHHVASCSLDCTWLFQAVVERCCERWARKWPRPLRWLHNKAHKRGSGQCLPRFRTHEALHQKGAMSCSHHQSVPEVEVMPRHQQEACDMVEKAGLSCAKVISIWSELWTPKASPENITHIAAPPQEIHQIFLQRPASILWRSYVQRHLIAFINTNTYIHTYLHMLHDSFWLHCFAALPFVCQATHCGGDTFFLLHQSRPGKQFSLHGNQRGSMWHRRSMLQIGSWRQNAAEFHFWAFVWFVWVGVSRCLQESPYCLKLLSTVVTCCYVALGDTWCWHVACCRRHWMSWRKATKHKRTSQMLRLLRCRKKVGECQRQPQPPTITITKKTEEGTFVGRMMSHVIG